MIRLKEVMLLVVQSYSTALSKSLFWKWSLKPPFGSRCKVFSRYTRSLSLLNLGGGGGGLLLIWIFIIIKDTEHTCLGFWGISSETWNIPVWGSEVYRVRQCLLMAVQRWPYRRSTRLFHVASYVPRSSVKVKVTLIIYLQRKHDKT